MSLYKRIAGLTQRGNIVVGHSHLHYAMLRCHVANQACQTEDLLALAGLCENDKLAVLLEHPR